jgi:antitoxin component HigA of HigAB toxin-antitoxin module
MDIRVIKTKQQYRRYLEEVDRLVALDPDPRSAEGARLELLATRQAFNSFFRASALAVPQAWRGTA